MMSPSNSVLLQPEDGAGANKDGEGAGTLLYDTMQYYKERLTLTELFLMYITTEIVFLDPDPVERSLIPCLQL